MTGRTNPDEMTLEELKAHFRSKDEREATKLKDHPGIQALEEYRSQTEREQARAEQERGARFREREASKAREVEERMKADAYDNWITNGGNPEDFEGAWPNLRSEILKRRVLEGESVARAASFQQMREAF